MELYTFYLVGLFLRYNLTAAVTKWPETFSLSVVKDMFLCSFTKSRKKKKKVNRASKDLLIARMVWHKTYLGSEAATGGGAGPQVPSIGPPTWSKVNRSWCRHEIDERRNSIRSATFFRKSTWLSRFRTFNVILCRFKEQTEPVCQK